MEGFKIICNECNKEIIVKDDTTNKNYKESGYKFYPIQNNAIEISCNCGNEVFIFEK